ncbi:hypothetical protein P3S67_015028 [Capsicum chacoense]
MNHCYCLVCLVCILSMLLDLLWPQRYPAYLAMKMSQFSNVEKADWIFDNSFQELEGEIARGVSKFWPANLIGPMVPSSYLDGRIEGDKRMLKECKLPKGFIKCSKGKGLIVSWCNQLETLANQAIGCFVTHYDWNSTLEGLSLGMPMVAVPQWSDQMTDAKFIGEIWKIGVRPNLDELLGIVGRGAIILFK